MRARLMCTDCSAAAAAVEKFLSDAGVRRAVTAGGRKQTETKAHAVRERERTARVRGEINLWPAARSRVC